MKIARHSFGPNPYHVFSLLDENGVALEKPLHLGLFELEFDDRDDGCLQAVPVEPSASKTERTIWEAKFAGVTLFGIELHGYEALDKSCALFREVNWLLVQALPAADLIARIEAATIAKLKSGGFKEFGLDKNQS